MGAFGGANHVSSFRSFLLYKVNFYSGVISVDTLTRFIFSQPNQSELIKSQGESFVITNTWLRDQYPGPGGGLYVGPGGGMYIGPGGGAYAGPGGGMYVGPGGGLYVGPGGGLYVGPGGGLYEGPGGGLYQGPGGGLYPGPGGGLYAGPGGGMYSGPCENPYRSNIPPWPVFIQYLDQNGLHEFASLIKTYLP